MTIPSLAELDAWEAALKNGQAITGMWPRFTDGYRRLLMVAEKAKKVASKMDGGGYWVILAEIDEACVEGLEPLDEALDALVEPKK